MDVKRMFLLADVARHGSITAAAHALAYTPSAVSQQIQSLDDPMELVVARTHRLARRRRVRFAELADERWIIRTDAHPAAEVLTRSCRAAGFEPRVSFEAHDYQEAQGM